MWLSERYDISLTGCYAAVNNILPLKTKIFVRKKKLHKKLFVFIYFFFLSGFLMIKQV